MEQRTLNIQHRRYPRTKAAPSRFAWLALVLLALWLGPTSADAASSPGGLVVEGSNGKSLIEYAPVTGPERKGSFTLLLRNTGSRPLRPRLTLDPAGAGPVLYMHLVSPPPTAPPRLRSVGKVPTIEPNGVARLALLVDLPSAIDPHALDGTLALRAVTPHLVPVGSTTLVPISAGALDLKALTLVPTAVTLRTTTWLPWGSAAAGGKADIELRGLGIDALIEAGRLNGRALLHSENGRTVPVRVGVERSQDGRQQPFVEVVGRAEAGTYTGALPISASADSPTVSVTVVSHDGIIWAIAAVALGTVLGGLLPLLGARARQRNVLRARLQAQLLDYFAAAANDNVMNWPGLTEAVGTDKAPWNSRRWMPEPALTGAAGLFSALRFAQNEEELTDVGEKVEDLNKRISRWLALAPKVLALAEVQQVDMSDLNGTLWASTGTRSDSHRLMYRAAWIEPTDAEAKDEALLLTRQTEWHREVGGAWQQLAVAWEELGASHRDKLFEQLRELAFAPEASTRDGERWTDLRAQLADFLTDLAAALPRGRLDAEAPMAEFVWHPAEETAGAERAWKRLRAGAVRSLRAAGHRVRRGVEALLPESTKPARLIAAAQRQDIVLSIIAASGAVLVFVLQIYTDTWGTSTDYLAAVAAGFGAQVVVRWGALPIFESWERKQAEQRKAAATSS